MNKILKLVLLSITLIPILTNAQRLDGTNTYRTQNAYINLINKVGKADVADEKIKGSPYYSKLFSIGKIFIKSKPVDKDYALRYNAYKDEIEVHNGLDIDILYKNPNVSCKILNEKYTYKEYKSKDGSNKFGYLNTIFEGKKIKLYLRKTKILKQGKKAKTSLTTSVPPKLVDFESYYYSINDETPYKIKMKNKELISLFNSKNQPAIKKYIKKNNLKFKKASDILKLFKYCDSLE